MPLMRYTKQESSSLKEGSQMAEDKILFFDDSVDIGKEPLPITDPNVKAIIDKYLEEFK